MTRENVESKNDPQKPDPQKPDPQKIEQRDETLVQKKGNPVRPADATE